jgi:aspartate 1-decarboxylase
MTYVQVDEPVPEEWTPRIVLVDERNRVAEIVRVDSRGSLLAARKHEIERHEAPPRT